MVHELTFNSSLKPTILPTKWQDHQNSLVTAFSLCEYSRKTKESGDYKQVASFSSVQKDP